MRQPGFHIIFRNTFAFLFFAAIILSNFYCSSEPEKKEETSDKEFSPWFNHSDTARYVGMQPCRQCHQDKFDSFLHTGMGLSFDYATREKSSATFGSHAVIYDKHSDFYYHPFWDKDSTMKMMEFRMEGKDTVYKRVEKVDYVIGSGQHTNSHIQNVNGYLNQMPMTFYTQKGKWDMPPGFENGMNTRFTRKIGLECMSCHNSFPDFVLGSENKYNAVPQGIGCERCHGPGSIHVQKKNSGERIDTSKYIDYSIVNPGKLSIDLQFDVCQRCHLQGNTVLKEGKSFYDFRPGMKLSDYMTVFLPKYEGAEDEFIMASHADRLKMSQCFIKSFKPEEDENSLRPYKQSMTCVTCHNPHVSVKATGKEVFNNACKNCHGGGNKTACTEKPEARSQKGDDCVSCHMPKSGSIDIPHVRVTDHFIRKPVAKEEIEKVKKFIGLYAVNEKKPSKEIKAKAYLSEYEKYEAKTYYLDSAEKYLSDKTRDDIRKNFHSLVHLRLLKKEYKKIEAYMNSLGREDVLVKILVKKSFSNADAWTAYRIGESFQETGNTKNARAFYQKADELAPFYLEFKNKHAVVLLESGETGGAQLLFQKILEEDPRHVSALTNLGYICLLQGDDKKAEELYNKGLSYDPDYESLLMNKAGLFIYRKQWKEARIMLKRVLKKYPGNKKAKEVLDSIKNNV